MKAELLPERLINVRESLNLNKSQAAELMGLSPIGYLRYEQGIRMPSPQMLKIIALTLGTSVDYLTGKTDDPSADQLIVSKEDNYALFELVQKVSEKDSDTVNRLLAYYRKIE